MKIKKTVDRMLRMCPLAWYIFKTALILCSLLLACACVMLVLVNCGVQNSYRLYMSSAYIVELTQTLLLLAVLSSVIIEDLQK